MNNVTPHGRRRPGDVESGGPLDEALRELAEARMALQKAKQTVKDLQAVQDERERVVFDTIESMGLTGVRHPWGTFYLNDQAWPRVTDRETARDWANENLPELITLDLARLRSIVGAYMKGERPDLPPGVDFTVTRRVGWRRGNDRSTT